MDPPAELGCQLRDVQEKQHGEQVLWSYENGQFRSSSRRPLCDQNPSQEGTCRLSGQPWTAHRRLTGSRGKAFGANNDFFHHFYYPGIRSPGSKIESMAGATAPARVARSPRCNMCVGRIDGERAVPGADACVVLRGLRLQDTLRVPLVLHPQDECVRLREPAEGLCCQRCRAAGKVVWTCTGVSLDDPRSVVSIVGAGHGSCGLCAGNPERRDSGDRGSRVDALCRGKLQYGTGVEGGDSGPLRLGTIAGLRHGLRKSLGDRVCTVLSRICATQAAELPFKAVRDGSRAQHWQWHSCSSPILLYGPELECSCFQSEPREAWLCGPSRW